MMNRLPHTILSYAPSVKRGFQVTFTFYGVVWCGVVWYDVVWCGMG